MIHDQAQGLEFGSRTGFKAQGPGQGQAWKLALQIHLAFFISFLLTMLKNPFLVTLSLILNTGSQIIPDLIPPLFWRVYFSLRERRLLWSLSLLEPR